MTNKSNFNVGTIGHIDHSGCNPFAIQQYMYGRHYVFDRSYHLPQHSTALMSVMQFKSYIQTIILESSSKY